MSLLENFKKRGLKDILNPKKWWIYIKSKFKYVLIKESEAVSYSEQLIYRMWRCKECVENGSCIHCGCKSPGLFIDKNNWCSADTPKWDKMTSPEKWEEFKKRSKIKITVNFT